MIILLSVYLCLSFCLPAIGVPAGAQEGLAAMLPLPFPKPADEAGMLAPLPRAATAPPPVAACQPRELPYPNPPAAVPGAPVAHAGPWQISEPANEAEAPWAATAPPPAAACQPRALPYAHRPAPVPGAPVAHAGPWQIPEPANRADVWAPLDGAATAPPHAAACQPRERPYANPPAAVPGAPVAHAGLWQIPEPANEADVWAPLEGAAMAPVRAAPPPAEAHVAPPPAEALEVPAHALAVPVAPFDGLAALRLRIQHIQVPRWQSNLPAAASPAVLVLDKDLSDFAQRDNAMAWAQQRVNAYRAMHIGLNVDAIVPDLLRLTRSWAPQETSRLAICLVADWFGIANCQGGAQDLA